MKVLISDTIADECLQKIKEEGLEVDYRPSADENELRQALGDADALIVRSGTKVTSGLLESAPALKVIGRAGTGVDNIDIPAATERGILVMNSPSGNTISAAEHTFAIMLALARNIHTAHDSIKEGRWDRKKYKGIELYGKTLGIIGLGRIGREVLKRALAFGMKVISYDPYVSESGARDAGCEKVDLNSLLKTADIITVHIPLNDETENLIARKELSMMKKNALLINSARGGIVNEKDLAKALGEGLIKGASIDVYENEPPSDSPLCGIENICHTPHLAASTNEAQIRCGVVIAGQVSDYLKTGKVTGAVNDVAEVEKIKNDR